MLGVGQPDSQGLQVKTLRIRLGVGLGEVGGCQNVVNGDWNLVRHYQWFSIYVLKFKTLTFKSIENIDFWSCIMQS